MSAVNTPAASVPAIKEKKPRAPTLPAKFGKFIQFGYYLLKTLNVEGQEPAVDEALFMETICVHASIDDQQTFVQGFFDEAKDINKTLRQLVLQKKRAQLKAEKAAAKEPKEKKPRAKKVKAEESETEGDAAPKEKKPRAKKATKAASAEDDLVNQLVAAANGAEPVVEQAEPKAEKKPRAAPKAKAPKEEVKAEDQAQAEPKVKEAKAPKEEVKAEDQAQAQAEPKVKEAKAAKEPKVKDAKPAKEPKVKAQPKVKAEPKVKPAKEPKAKAVKDSKPTEQPAPPADTDPDDLEVSVFEFQGKQFLIDANNTVYDLHSHDPVANFDPASNSLSFL
jgi:hypothetical protein